MRTHCIEIHCAITAAALLLAVSVARAEAVTAKAPPAAQAETADAEPPHAAGRAARSSFLLRNGKIEAVKPATRAPVVTPDDTLKCR